MVYIGAVIAGLHGVDVMKGKTSSIKSYNPEWKEVLVFTDMFPPLCNRIKIQLCDSDITSDEVIATHFIQLSQIMDPGGDTEGTRYPSLVSFAIHTVGVFSAGL